VGTLAKLLFDVPGGEVRARAMVKNNKSGQGMAVAFIDMGYGDGAGLNQLVFGRRCRISRCGQPSGNQRQIAVARARMVASVVNSEAQQSQDEQRFRFHDMLPCSSALSLPL
jgi:hypothetical protein